MAAAIIATMGTPVAIMAAGMSSRTRCLVVTGRTATTSPITDMGIMHTVRIMHAMGIMVRKAIISPIMIRVTGTNSHVTLAQDITPAPARTPSLAPADRDLRMMHLVLRMPGNDHRAVTVTALRLSELAIIRPPAPASIRQDRLPRVAAGRDAVPRPTRIASTRSSANLISFSGSSRNYGKRQSSRNKA